MPSSNDLIKNLRHLANSLKFSNVITDNHYVNSSEILSFLKTIWAYTPDLSVVVEEGSFSGISCDDFSAVESFLKEIDSTQTNPTYGISFLAADGAGLRKGVAENEFTWAAGQNLEAALADAAAELNSTPFKDNPVAKYLGRLSIRVESPEAEEAGKATQKAVYPPGEHYWGD